MATKTKKPKRRPINQKQLIWHERYAEHHNARLAAIEAGYSPKNAAQTGSRLLNDADLAMRINAYGQYGMDRLAVIASQDYNLIAAERAAEKLADRAYGTPQSNSDDKHMPDINIILNKIDSSGARTEGQTINKSNIIEAVADPGQGE